MGVRAGSRRSPRGLNYAVIDEYLPRKLEEARRVPALSLRASARGPALDSGFPAEEELPAPRPHAALPDHAVPLVRRHAGAERPRASTRRLALRELEDPRSRATAKAGSGPVGSVMTVDFQLAGQRFVALNGGPIFKFTEAVSFVVNCKDQKEIDRFWRRLGARRPRRRVRLASADRYGLSRQVVPTALWKMVDRQDPARSARMMQAAAQDEEASTSPTLEAAYGPVAEATWLHGRRSKPGAQRRTRRRR